MAERCRRRVAGAAHLLEQDARMEGKALSDVSVWGCLPCFMLFNPFTANSFVSHAVVVVFLLFSSLVSLQKKDKQTKTAAFQDGVLC